MRVCKGKCLAAQGWEAGTSCTTLWPAHLELRAAALVCVCCRELPWCQVDLAIQFASAIIDHNHPLQAAHRVTHKLELSEGDPPLLSFSAQHAPCCLLLPARRLWGSTDTAPGHPPGPAAPQQTASSAHTGISKARPSVLCFPCKFCVVRWVWSNSNSPFCPPAVC